MPKTRKRAPNPRLATVPGRLAYAYFCLATGLPIPGERPARNPLPADHPPEVYQSFRNILRVMGANNPDAYFARWTLEEILPEMNEVILAINADDAGKIQNPAGLLWTMLDTKYPGRAGT